MEKEEAREILRAIIKDDEATAREKEITRGLALIDEAMRLHSDRYGTVRHVYAMVSGGHDSISAGLIASKHPNFRAVVHIDTGIGIPQTQDFVRDLCAGNGWPLMVIRAKEDCGQDYEALVLAHGFPGPAHHFKMYQRLKERGIEYLFRHHIPRPDRAVLVSGIRLEESARRADPKRAQNQTIERSYRRIWVKAIHEWSKIDVTDFVEARPELRRNPVVDLLHKSGECLCGAFAHEGELAWIEACYPEVGARIRDLERRVRERGFEWGWEERPPKPCGRSSSRSMGMCERCEQLTLFSEVSHDG